MRYCDPSDVYALGFPRGSVPNPGRVATAANVSTNAVTLADHGFAEGDEVRFRAEGSGSSVPTPLVEGVTYYALPASVSTFAVASTIGGAPLDLTTTGARFLVIAPLPIEASINWASLLIADMLPAHAVPEDDAVPPIVRATCAELTAWKLAKFSGADAPSLTEVMEGARKRLERWATGVPLRGENVPTATNLAQSAAAPYRDRRGWSRYGGRESC